MADAIALRFPGTGDVDLKLLCEAWLADPGLSHGDLGYCAYLASKLAAVNTGGSLIQPRHKLRELIASLTPPPP